MYKNKIIKPPFFEIGPKAFMYGDRMLKLARAADEASAKYDVRIISTLTDWDFALDTRY